MFAIVAQKSMDYDFAFHAEYIGMLHEYQIFIDEKPTQELVEVYDYEWTDEEV